jgi:hypothetical protein
VLVSGLIHVSSGYAQAVMSGADPHEVAWEPVSDSCGAHGGASDGGRDSELLHCVGAAADWAEGRRRGGAHIPPRSLLVNDGMVTRLVEASVLDRLPKAFTTSLLDNPKGLGGLIDETRVETRRNCSGSATEDARVGRSGRHAAAAAHKDVSDYRRRTSGNLDH